MNHLTVSLPSSTSPEIKTKLEICRSCPERKGQSCRSVSVLSRIHSDCPLSKWTKPKVTAWFIGDLASGGITTFLATLIPALVKAEENHPLKTDYHISSPDPKSAHISSPDPKSAHIILISSTYQLSLPALSLLRRFATVELPSTDMSGHHIPIPPSRYIEVAKLADVVHLISCHPKHTPIPVNQLPRLPALLSSPKYLLHLHGAGEWTNEIISHCLPLSPTIVANSDWTWQSARSYLLSKLGNLPTPPHPSVIIPLPVDRNNLVPAHTKLEDRLFIQSKARRNGCKDLKSKWIAYCGRSTPEKQLPLLIRLVEEINKYEPVTLVLALGEIPPELHSQIIESIVPCILLPWLPSSEVVRFYNAADLTICTSSSEGGPYFMIEALLSGCPVASTLVGHMPSLLPLSSSLFLPLSFDILSPQNVFNVIATHNNQTHPRNTNPSHYSNGLPSALSRFSLNSVLSQWQEISRRSD